MANVPGVFNRNDFVSILLPGYVNVISLVVIFRPGLLTFKDLSFDLFSAVLLIVAGPSLGITLRQLYRTAWLAFDEITKRVRRLGDGREKGNDRGRLKAVPPKGPNNVRSTRSWAAEYARIRLNAEPRELGELDAAEAEMDFNASTALGLLLQALAGLVIPLSPLAILGLLMVSLALFAQGYSEWLYAFAPTYNEISSRYPPRSTTSSSGASTEGPPSV